MQGTALDRPLALIVGFCAVLLPLDDGKSDPLDECPLGKEKEHDNRYCQNGCNCHHPSPLNTYRADKYLDSQGESVLARIIEVDQRPNEIIPATQELKKRYRSQSRFCQWKYDPPQDAEL